MEVLLWGLSCCFLPSLGLSSAPALLRRGISVGVSASCTLLSHDGCSLAHWPLTPTSTLLTMSCQKGQQNACSHVNRGRVVRSVFFPQVFLRKIKRPSMWWSSQQTAKECVNDTIQRFKWNGVCNLWLVCWCVQAGGVAFLCTSFFFGDILPASPKATNSLVFNACEGMWLFWSISSAFNVTDCELLWLLRLLWRGLWCTNGLALLVVWHMTDCTGISSYAKGV